MVSFSRIIALEKVTNCFTKGNSMRVVVTLKITWKTDTRICRDMASLPGKKAVSRSITGWRKIQIIAVNAAVPMVLKVKWIRAIRLELALAPAQASSAVTQVPMLAPSTINRARSSSITPVPTMVMTTPVAAEELWIRTVKIAPTKINSKGKLMTLKMFVNICLMRALPKASGLLIISRPTKIKPRPLHSRPASLTF